MAKWELYLISHSHTDIGYTEYQEKLEYYHADYIRQAVGILKRIDAGELQDCRDFRWQCENYWQVERFFEEATEEEKEAFLDYVRQGRIGLSGNYLNLTELVSRDVLMSRLKKAKAFADENVLTVKSAMSADINGYSWGYPDALSDSGVEHLFCALHAHHGMFPMGHNPSFFWWKGPRGGRVLTFVGEYYHLGNELGFCPHGNTSYALRDDVCAQMQRGEILRTDEAATEEEELDIVRRRLPRYLEGLEAAGYPLRFAPIMVSGVISDNAPPNARVAARVEQINKMLGALVHVRMATLDDFFGALRVSGTEIPEYSGDFTDWWADGVGSTPAAVKMYLEARRHYDLVKKLDPQGRFADPALMDQAEYNMMLYSEHTWGYSSSISEPWNSMVASLGMKKSQYAVAANVAAYRNLNKALTGLGQRVPYPDRPIRYRIVNPQDFAVKDRATVILNHYEMLFGRVVDRRRPLALRDAAAGKLLPSQMRPAPRGTAVETALTLGPHESMEVEVVFAPESTQSNLHFPLMGAEGVRDMADAEGMETPYEIDTPFFHVRTDREKGVCSIVDKQSGRELLDQTSPYGAFEGIYEVTPSGEQGQMGVRHDMGRNRCSFGTRRSTVHFTNARIVDSGAVSVTLKLTGQLEGMEFYDTYIKIYKPIPVIEARICMHKKGNLDPENLYVALPFTAGGKDETYIDKTGCVMRPGIDQLPGTCQSFWLLQNGIVRKGEERDVILSCHDAPLVSFGPREAAPIRLCYGTSQDLNASTPFSWVMNNFWETNFEANLGGVYEFFYTMTVAPAADAGEQMRLCQALNEGLTVLDL